MPVKKDLNVYQKLQLARMMFLEANPAKTGTHNKLEYKYFQLSDIVPAATRIFQEVGLLMIPTIHGEIAKADVYNADNPEDEILTFVAPYTPIAPIISNSGAQVTNAMQATGSSITYIRRYLWQLVLDIIEIDDIDNGDWEEKFTASKKAPATPQTRTAVKEKLTATPADAASEEDVATLKELLKELMNTDEEQESFVQEIAMKTEAFSKITSEQCAQLISGVTEMLSAYTPQEG